MPRARKGQLEVEDLPLPKAQRAEPAYEEFTANWEAEVEAAAKAGTPPKLMRVGGGAERGGVGWPVAKVANSRLQPAHPVAPHVQCWQQHCPCASANCPWPSRCAIGPTGAAQDLRPRPDDCRHLQALLDGVCHHGR